MNSRERVLASINHQEPDRVPVDLGGSTVTGISAIACNNLKKHLGILKPTRIFDVVQQLANVDNEIIELFGVDIIRFGDDLGMTSGPLMDLSTFRKLLKPRYKELCTYVKQNSDMKIFLHSCGSIRQFIPDLIESGFDIINPVQTNCYDMDAAELKREFGNEITFWGGGVDSSGILNMGTAEDVRRDVLRRCEIFAKGGGFVFAPIHNILPEVPPGNVIAAYKAVNEFNGRD